jgi:hypothetical protein
MAVSAEIRKRLIAFAQSRRSRRVEFTSRSPCRWQPRQFTDPRSGQAFTDEGAWEYIVQHLEADAVIEEIEMEKPPGSKGYVLHLPGINRETIYVKLQLCGDHVRGRSFHESEAFERRAISPGDSRCRTK